MMPAPPEDCRAGHDALLRAAWPEARDAFTGALAARESPEALEGLGLAAWWLDLADVLFEARERAYTLYRERGDETDAARVAVWLAWDYWAFRGESAVASGWLQRARRLLEHAPLSAERAWLEVREGSLCLYEDHDPERAHALATEGSASRAPGPHRHGAARARGAGSGARDVRRGRRRDARARRGQRRRGRRRDARLRRDRARLLLHGRGVRARARLRSRRPVGHAAQSASARATGCGRCSRSAGRTPPSACGAGPGWRPSRSCPRRPKSSTPAVPR